MRHATCERSAVSRGEGQQKAEVHRDLEQASKADIDGVGKSRDRRVEDSEVLRSTEV